MVGSDVFPIKTVLFRGSMLVFWGVVDWSFPLQSAIKTSNFSPQGFFEAPRRRAWPIAWAHLGTVKRRSGSQGKLTDLFWLQEMDVGCTIYIYIIHVSNPFIIQQCN